MDAIETDEAKATPEQPEGFAPIKVKGLRADIQSFIDFVNSYDIDSREVNIAVQKLQEAKMWFGKHLGTLPEGGEDLNAKRDADELGNAYPEKEDVPAPAEGEDKSPAAEGAPAPAEGTPAPAEGQDAVPGAAGAPQAQTEPAKPQE